MEKSCCLLWCLECLACYVSLGEYSLNCPPEFRVLKNLAIAFRASKQIAECFLLFMCRWWHFRAFYLIQTGALFRRKTNPMSGRKVSPSALSCPPVFNTSFSSRGTREQRWKTLIFLTWAKQLIFYYCCSQWWINLFFFNSFKKRVNIMRQKPGLDHFSPQLLPLQSHKMWNLGLYKWKYQAVVIMNTVTSDQPHLW